MLGARPGCGRPAGRDGGSGDVAFLRSFGGLIGEAAPSRAAIRGPRPAIFGGLGTGVWIFAPCPPGDTAGASDTPAAVPTTRPEPAPTAVIAIESGFRPLRR